MKKYIICLSFLFISVGVLAQESLMAKSNKVFIENTSKNEKAIKTSQELENRLKEWAYWSVVDNKEDADFVINVEPTASKGITATSWGGTSYSLAAIFKNKEGDILWESDVYKASPNGTNGFNAGNAVVKKLIRDLKRKYSN